MHSVHRPLLALAALAGVALGGCSTVRGSAVATGPLQPAYAGPVAIYAANSPPAGAVDLGVVEASAAQSEGTVEILLPLFAKKVAQIGGNIARVDGVRARFELVTMTHLETVFYPCGLRAQCAGQRAYTTTDEVVVVRMFGHALSDRVGAVGSATTPSPLPPPPSTPPPSPPGQEEEEGTSP